MFKKEFLINAVDKVKKFVSLAGKTAEDVDLIRGRYTIDAKSLMGIFSLDLSKPVTVAIYTKDAARAEEFFKAVEEVLK